MTLNTPMHGLNTTNSAYTPPISQAATMPNTSGNGQASPNAPLGL